ncbi:MAG: hypothetical protein RI947_556 [Candidatus Parcubacteria bacterium]|jgi:type IV pilus assembly protein PilM
MNNDFALEINEKYTRVSEIKYDTKNKKIELISLASEPTTPLFFSSENEKIVEKQGEVISKLYGTLKNKSRTAHVIIPDGYTFSQIIEMPKLKEKELLSAIHYQADEFIPMPIEETSMDLEILREDPKTHKVLLLIVASPRKIVSQVEKSVEMAGLIPDTLENELSACGRLFSEAVTFKGNATLILNFGFSNSSIYLVDNQLSLIMVARTLKIGLDLFVRDIMVNLNWEEKKVYEVLKTIGLNKDASYNIESIVMPLLKELFQELEKMVAMARDKYNLRVEEIQIFNFDNYIAQLPQKIQAYFSLPTQSVNLAQNLVANPLAQSNSKDISSYVSVIAANLR